MNILDVVDAASLRKDIPQFRAGDELKIHVRVIEGNKSRLQVFQGVVIRRQGDGVRERRALLHRHGRGAHVAGDGLLTGQHGSPRVPT